jgi:hypothetical protein
MMNERFIDLDELVLLCQDKVTKGYIWEAVACYKAGAFRSCIVSTWNAVVFDFLYKLRQLELTGDGQARDQLNDFERCRLEDKRKELWEFEINIPKDAREKYEFISPMGRKDLEQICQDRNRCAHPSMQSIEEPFTATPELARCHLRSAITHLLQYPPVQGRAALDLIWNMIKSEGFPENTEQAINVLKDSYLGRARDALIKDIVVGLTTSLFLDDAKKPKERCRMYAALEAVSNLYFQQFQETISSDKFFKIIESVPDNKWYKVWEYLRRMKVWDSLKKGLKIKAETFINSINNLDEGNNSFILTNALEIPKMKDIVLNKIKSLKGTDLKPLIEVINKYKENINISNISEIVKDYKKDAVEAFVKSITYRQAEVAGSNLILVSTWLTIEEIREILTGFCENNQIHGAYQIPEIMMNIFQETPQLAELVKDDWLLVRQKIEHEKRYVDLVQLIDTQYGLSEKEQ